MTNNGLKWQTVMRMLRHWLHALGQILGDGEYDRYCEHVSRKHPGMQPVSAREFYLRRLEERYTRPQRCC